jgi:hypothetical protein
MNQCDDCERLITSEQKRYELDGNDTVCVCPKCARQRSQHERVVGDTYIPSDRVHIRSTGQLGEPVTPPAKAGNDK